jgi:hypothetical protein
MPLIQEQLSPTVWRKLVEVYPRIALTGVVNSGKTLLLEEGGRGTPPKEVIHTDVLSRKDWATIPSKICSLVTGKESFILAGTQVPRCLRKGLEVDAVVWLNTSRTGLDRRQEGFGKGIRKIMHAWRHRHPEIPVYFSPRALHDRELARMPE